MKYKIEDDIIIGYWQDETGVAIPYVNEDSIKDLYIIGSDTRNRNPMEELENMTEWDKPKSVPTNLININYNTLKADVVDQYGQKMDIDIDWSIEGDVAKIENGKVVVDEVEEDTPYTIIARVGDLEERQERTIYAPREVEPSEIDILNKKIELLASENEAKDDLLQEIILQMYS